MLLLVGALFVLSGGGVASAASILHVGTSQAKAIVVSPNISRVPCVGTHQFRIWTDRGQDIDCFANAGTLPVALYNASLVCTGYYSGDIAYILDGYAYDTGTLDRNECQDIVPILNYHYP